MRINIPESGHGIQEVSGSIPLISTIKALKTIGFQGIFFFLCFFGWIFRPLEFSANLSHSRGVVMARISMRNVQKYTVSSYLQSYGSALV